MLISLLLIFGAAALAPWLLPRRPLVAGWSLAALLAALFAWYASLLPTIADGAVLHQAIPWVPHLGARLTFQLDGLSLLFALLITGIGAFVVVYAAAYLRDHPLRGRFFAFLLLFTGAMLGLVLADNVIALIVFWELTSFSSYLLIGFEHESARTRERAFQALIVTGAGGLALLAGLVLLGAVAGGSYDLSQIALHGEAIREHALYLPILLLVALGAFTKSAQVPFHFWLPNAMDAPTPVSAYLHSATMVKAGVYMLARLQPTLGWTELWMVIITPVGAVTAVVGAVLALRQVDLKLVLAYSTISALGILTMSLGMSLPEASIAALAFLLAHAFYKGALFLSAGAIDHSAGSRDVTALGGLAGAMPFTALGATVAGLSMAGAPFMFGFVGKELLYKAALGSTRPTLWTFVVVTAGIFTVVAAGIVVLRPFFGRRRASTGTVHPVPFAMWIGIFVLGVIGVVLGMIPVLADPLLAPAVAAVLGHPEPIHLAPWYGVDTALVLSVVTLALGVAGYLVWDPCRALLGRADRLLAHGPEWWYDSGLRGLQRFAELQTRVIQNGKLRNYLFTILLVLVVLPGVTLLRAGPLPLPVLPPAQFYEYALATVIVLASAAAAVVRSRVAALASVGVVGVGLSVLFVLLGAPDLAMTQFLVDMLVVVVALLIMRLLPRLQPGERSERWVRLRDASVALGVGTLVATLLLIVTAGPLDTTVATFYARASVPEAFGRNIVNVILVDFRALDTLGEIIVLAVAALGAHALVRFRKMPPARTAPRSSLIMRTTTRFLFTLLVLFSFFLLLRGHDSPGGGFIGGLIAAGAFALYMLAYGADGLRTLLRVHPRSLLAVGLLIALGSGVLGMLLGQPFLTAQWALLPFGDSEPLKVGTPLLFDVGVYLVVLGFTLTLALDLEEA